MSCPACLAEAAGAPLGAHRDPIEGREYRLFRCPACGVTYSEPREAPGADYYRRTHSSETRVYPDDWRHAYFFEEGLRPGALLDVACGDGHFLLKARARGWTVSGFDFNEEYVAAAKSAGLQDIETASEEGFLAAHPSRFDAVTLFDALEHTPEPARLLGLILSALKPGGALVLSVPNAARPLLGEGSRERFDFPPYHFTRWTAEGLERALRGAGFKDVRLRVSPLPHGYFTGLLYYRLLNVLFPWFKRLLLGAGSEQKTWTDLAAERKAPAAVSDAGARQRLVDAGYWVLRVLFVLFETPAVLAMNLLAPGRGRNLFVLARKP